MYGVLFLPLTLLFLLSGFVRADVAPLVTRAASPLFEGLPGASTSGTGSLFAGRAEGSLFAPFPDRIRPSNGGAQGQVAALFALIAEAEAGVAGYDAYNHGARIPPPRAPSQMSLGEIYAWIAATPGQPHAIGRYQFIPDTLRRVARLRGHGPEVPFTAEVQDDLALILLEEAGLMAFEGGTLGRREFMQNLARIWAGLPLPNGLSYYHGHAGNRATMTWARFDAGIEAIWPRG
ncbi:hypothetical protein HKCCE4037_16360 [Rhodobacterales bacterium HKCCE4037]|nr:hypothetical protein [Rhodobacterales bacterium HKCCE4037]